jgi:esterase
MPVKLNYQAHGEGKPLLLLHGLFGSGRNWSGIARQLSGSYKVVTVDLRNHGASGHADSMAYTEMAEDIARLVTSLGQDSICILGHSMGGKTAMTLSLLNPALVERLIVVDIAPAKYLSNHDDLISAMHLLPVNKLKNRNQADVFLSQYIPEPRLRQFILQNLVRDEDAGYKWRINLKAIQDNQNRLRDFPAELKGMSFEGPALFLSGSLSDYIGTHHQDAINAYFPESTHVVIEDAKHWVHADKPDEVIKAVSRFLD